MLVSKPFSFVANCKLMEAAIKKASSVMATTLNPTFFVLSAKKRVSVVAMSGDTFVSVGLLDTKADADGAFVFVPETLVGMIKNRTELKFAYNKQSLHLEQVKGRYKADLNVPSPTSDHESSYETFTASKPEDSVALSPDLLGLIREGLVATNIKDVYQGTTLLSFIDLKKDGSLRVTSFDSQHFSSYSLNTSIKKCELRIALPTSHFALIDNIAGGVEAAFSMSGGCIHVSGKGFAIALPATQAEDGHFIMVETFMQALSKPAYKCRYDNDQLSSMTDNLFTLYNVNTTFTLSAKADSAMLTVDFSTSSGTASDAIKVSVPKGSKAFTASVDPRLFKDILTLARNIKVPELSITDQVVVIQGKQEDAAIFLACARSE